MSKPAPPRRRRKPKPKKENGRPPHVPDKESTGAVEALAAFGFGVEKIADYLEISPNTLRKHYSKVLAKARPKLLGGAMSGLAKALSNSEGWAVKYVLNCHGKQFGWVERTEVTGADGGAIPIRLGSLNDSQLSSLLERLERGLAANPA